MERMLQKRFVRTAMVAVTALILILLGAINGVHWWTLRTQTQEMLVSLVQSPPGETQPSPDTFSQERWDRAMFLQPINDDTRMAARFFRAELSEEGEVLWVDVGQISSVTEAEATQYAQDIGDRTQGRSDRFRYLVAQSEQEGQRTAVFLDVSAERRSLALVLALSAGIGALCWLGMLLLVALLSRRAIRPIARNIEKQKQFVTNAGHELKTPLAIIQANTEAMELHQGQSKWTRNIRAQTQRLSGLMENLLILARMEEGTGNQTAQTVDLTALCAQCAGEFREAAALQGIFLEEELTPGVVVQADQSQLAQLLSVLLDNAVKYTTGEGEIRLLLTKEEGKAVLQVRNTPAHLPEGDTQRLFDRFYRGDPARTQKSGGYGIGLSAARAIAETWKGTLTARQEGETAIFTLKL
jgi:hypothetical protein